MKIKFAIIQLVAIFLALAAVVVSFELYKMHMKESVSSLFSAACGEGGESSADCHEVLSSPYGEWPPKKPDEPKDTRHIPVALLGMTYYACLAVWLIGVGRPTRDQRWIHLFPLLMNAIGLAMSAWFLWLMFSGVLGKWCPLCTLTHAFNVLIFLCMLLLWPKKPVAAAGAPGAAAALPAGGGGEAASTEPHLLEAMPVEAAADRETPNPTSRQLVATVLGLVLVWAGLSVWHMSVESAGKALQLKGCLATLEEAKSDTKRIVNYFDATEQKKIELRTDDPIRGGKEGEKGLVLVVFSDFECPHCDKQAFFLEEKVEPLFDGNLKIVFKNYPLNMQCNAVIPKTMHEHACKAAGLAEAARMQGGNKAFWQAHDFIFRNRPQLAELSADVLAGELHLDAERLRTDAGSEAVAKRIWEDVNLGAQLGVKGTPALYLSGKEVSTLLARMNIEFWDEMAKRYWMLRGVPRPESSKLKKEPPKAGEQGSK